MGKVPPKELRLRALGVEALAPGEVSAKVRIRGPEELFRLLERLSPKERGVVVKAGLEALGYLMERSHAQDRG